MARYGGGHEDVKKEAEELAALRKDREALAAAESKALPVEEKTATADEQGARKRTLKRKATEEGVQVEQRRARVAVESAKATDIDTAAIERNTQARLRQQRAAAFGPGLKGARDPLFAQAHGMTGDVTQTRLRRELGIGGPRAQSLLAAREAGFQPQRAGQAANRPFTRVRAAEAAVEVAERDLATASKALATTRKRATATEAELLGARDAQTVARAQKTAATNELKSAQQAQIAQTERTKQMREETAARRQAARALPATTPPGTGTPRAPLALPPAGGTSPISYRDLGRRGTMYRRDFGEIGGGGTVGGRGHQDLSRETQSKDRATASSRRYKTALSDEAAAKLKAQEASFAQADTRRAQTMAASAQATQRAAASYGTLSQAMTRHGALSAEFITATARGETSLRSLASQAVVTAGKFGGWTLAAGALFGAAAAAKKLGEGAIQSSSGVNTLRRVISNVNSDDAQQAFQDLSKQFNVPIDTAVDAVYRMGQRFHSLPKAVEAAKAALYSFKTGEVDVATSTENLLAITNGFGLNVAGLTDVYDKVNDAQNTFGVRIGDTEAGLAKAGGAFRQAGGDVDYLLALMTGISRATNRSGQEIGTGISRAATYIRKPISQQLLKEEGVEPAPDDLALTLRRTFKRARQPGADVQKLAQALVGNQMARLFTPVLKDPTITDAAEKRFRSGASKGSAAKELQTVLKETKEQVAELGNHLERLGSALSKGGFFTPLAAGLKFLNGMLGAAENLATAFSALPGPLRQAVALLGEGYLLLRVMHRFGGTKSLAGGPLGFLDNPDRRLRTYANRTTRDLTEGARGEAERTAAQAQRARFVQGRADAEAARVSGRYQAGPAKYAEDDKRRIAGIRAVTRANQQSETAAAAAFRAEQESIHAQQALAAADQEEATVRKLRGDNLRRHLLVHGYTLPRDLAVPTTAGTVAAGQHPLVGGPVAGRASYNRVREQFGLKTAAAAAPLGPANRLRESAEQRRLESTASLQSGQRRIAAAQRARAELEMGLSKALAGNAVGRGAVGAAQRLTSRTGQASRTIAGLRALPAAFAGTFGALAAALGPLDIAIGVVIGGYAFYKHVQDLNKKADESARVLLSSPQDAGGVERRNRAIRAAAERADDRKHPMAADNLGRPNIAKTAWNLYKGQYVDRLSGQKDIDEAAVRTQREQERLQKFQAARQGRGKFVPFQNGQQIGDSIRETYGQIRDGVISGHQINQHIRKLQQEILTGNFGEGEKGREGRAKAKGKLKRMIARINAVYGGALDVKDLSAQEARDELENTQTELAGAGYRGRKEDFKKVSNDYQKLSHGAKGAQGKELQQWLKDREAFYATYADAAQKEISEGLPFARSESARQAVFAHARQTLAGSLVKPRQLEREARERRDRIQDRIARNRAERDRLKGHVGPGSGDPFSLGDGPLVGGPGLDQTDAKAKIDKLNEKIGKDNAALGKAKSDLTFRQGELRDTLNRHKIELQKITDAAYQDRQEGRQTDLSLAQARTADPVKQSGEAIKSAQAGYRDALATYGKNARETRKALADLLTAQNQAVDAVIAGVDADNALLLARAGSDPVSQARATEQGSRNVLRTLQQQSAKGRKVDPNRMKLAEADVIKNHTATIEAARDEAKQATDLMNQIAVARAHGDPILAARLAQKAARQAMRSARTRVERLQALLDLVNANNAAEDAISDREKSRVELLNSVSEDDPAADYKRSLAQLNKDIRRSPKGSAERNRLMADRNKLRNDERTRKVQEKVDDIDFDLEMGKIERDEAIKRLQSILHSRGLTKQMRRDIQRRIKQLKDEAAGEAEGFNLDVGQLKLPTVYDVRRAWDPIRKTIKANAAESRARRGDFQPNSGDIGTAHRQKGGGHRAASAAVAEAPVNQNVNVNVFVTGKGEAGQVYTEIDRALGTHIKSRLRARKRR